MVINLITFAIIVLYLAVFLFIILSINSFSRLSKSKEPKSNASMVNSFRVSFKKSSLY